jgi:hypothetical protein
MTALPNETAYYAAAAVIPNVQDVAEVAVSLRSALARTDRVKVTL